MVVVYVLAGLAALFVTYILVMSLRRYNNPAARAEARKQGIAVLEPPAYEKPLKEAIEAQKQQGDSAGDGDSNGDGDTADKIVLKRNK